MGYTCGRKHTEESLREIAKQYKTRTDFQKNDPPAYTTSRRRSREFLDDICKHMVNFPYSTPQLMCKVIMEKLLGIKCLYNTRAIIKPYELDVYFPQFKLAVEYNGKGWHLSEITKIRDDNKKIICLQNEIKLIIVVENSRDYERDVKNQLIENLQIINDATNNNFTEFDINNIDCSNVYDEILNSKNIDEIKKKIKSCSNINEFIKNYISEYNFLKKNKMSHLLDEIRIRKTLTNDELLEECKKISDYSLFIKEHTKLYNRCSKRGLLDVATKHMTRITKIYKFHTDEELIDMANKFKLKSHLKRNDNSLFTELKKRKILNLVTYELEFVYKTYKRILKEKKVEKCFKDAEKYDNYKDFKSDKELYRLCARYKIIRKITDKFPKKDIIVTILEESKKYKNFEEFSKTHWYRKTKSITGLIGKIKNQNNWRYYISKEPSSFIGRFPKIAEMINQNIKTSEIIKITGVDKNVINRTKREMYDKGILKVDFKPRK